MDMFLQLFLTGICIGAVYGLGALGFVLIFKGSGVFNVAHGQMMMVGAFLMVAVSQQLGLNVYLSLLLAVLGTGFVAYACQFVLIRPMAGQPMFATVMITLALLFILRGIVTLVWGSDTYAYGAKLPFGSLKISGAYVASEYMAGLAVTLVGLGLFVLFFRYTKTGLAMRATADDEQLAESTGIRVRQVVGLVWALAGAAAALGGIVLGMMTSVNYLLDMVGMKVLPVAVFGGMESLAGAVVGGLIVGVVGNIAGGYLESFLPGFKEVAPFVIMLLALLVWPYGLFGEKRIERI